MARKQDDEKSGGGIHDEKAAMNPRGSFAEHSEHAGIRRISAGEFHIVSELIGRYSLEKQLAGVGVLALIAFERQVAQPEADQGKKQDDQKDECPVSGRRRPGSG